MSRHTEHTAKSPAADALEERRRLIDETIRRELHELLNDIGSYVRHFGVAASGGVAACAKEVLHDTYLKALEIADRYDPARPAGPWLRGIAVKIILHLVRSQSRERRSLTLVADTETVRRAADRGTVQELSETEMFDLLSRPHADAASAQTPGIEELLSLVEEADREVLRLRHEEGLDGEELAARLGTSVGAAYQRLSRARNRLRRKLQGSEN